VLLAAGGIFVWASGMLNVEKSGPVDVDIQGQTERIKRTGKKAILKTDVVVEDEKEEGTRIVVAQPVVHKITEEPDEGPPPTKPRVEVVIKDEPGDDGQTALVVVPIDPTPRVKYALRAPQGVPAQFQDFREGPPSKNPQPNKGVVVTHSPITFGVSATDAAGD